MLRCCWRDVAAADDEGEEDGDLWCYTHDDKQGGTGRLVIGD